MQPFVLAALLGSVLAQQPTGGQPGEDPQMCAQRCWTAMNNCRGQPGANQSTCQSDYANCLGYNPGPNAQASACINQGGQTPTTTQGGMPTGMPDDCAKRCTDTYNSCRSQPGANQSTCRSDFANCLGYNPDNDNPMWCKKDGMPSGTMSNWPTTTWPVQMDDCAKKCTDAYNTCRSQPGANQSTCASDYGNCLGFSPFGPSGMMTPTACSATGVTPTGTAPLTAGGAQLSPAYAALYALGVLALL
ncbi:hypothetical protein VFPPC_06606 [Pochonia chlamydosporia 170]|uniref:Uncharacterized protein n=1 Tax=Pochonia chlamydosporia 170 TaxID=1380566 RepID=A0A179F4W0_METCM|nr:hypothetical protein VFPPC_06606 [Pochonia chlamydosporia 170]OAQ60468.1 hypothetical protein VFPPC_06606 [Pochonia chlamydosporia 170]